MFYINYILKTWYNWMKTAFGLSQLIFSVVSHSFRKIFLMAETYFLIRPVGQSSQHSKIGSDFLIDSFQEYQLSRTQKSNRLV